MMTSPFSWLANKALQPTRAAQPNEQSEPAGSRPRG